MCLQRARDQNWCSLEATKLACKIRIRASLPGEYLTLPPTASQMYFPRCGDEARGARSP